MGQKKTIRSEVRHSINYLDPCRALSTVQGIVHGIVIANKKLS